MPAALPRTFTLCRVPPEPPTGIGFQGLECHNGLDAIGLFRALRTSGDYLWGFKLSLRVNLGLYLLDRVDAMATGAQW